MTEQADETREDTPVDEHADDGPTDAERLEALEEENATLRGQVETLSAVRDEADTRDRRLAEAQDENRALRRQAADAILDQALRAAAETLDVDPQLVLGIYKGNFKAAPDADGTFRVEPNPTEWLARKARSDPLLRRSALAVRQRKADNTAADSLARGEIDALSDEQVLSLVELFDREPQKKSRFIAEHPETPSGMPYLRLCARAQRLGYCRGKTVQGPRS